MRTIFPALALSLAAGACVKPQPNAESVSDASSAFDELVTDRIPKEPVFFIRPQPSHVFIADALTEEHCARRRQGNQEICCFGCREKFLTFEQRRGIALDHLLVQLAARDPVYRKFGEPESGSLNLKLGPNTDVRLEPEAPLEVYEDSYRLGAAFPNGLLPGTTYTLTFHRVETDDGLVLEGPWAARLTTPGFAFRELADVQREQCPNCLQALVVFTGAVVADDVRERATFTDERGRVLPAKWGAGAATKVPVTITFADEREDDAPTPPPLTLSFQLRPGVRHALSTPAAPIVAEGAEATVNLGRDDESGTVPPCMSLRLGGSESKRTTCRVGEERGAFVERLVDVMCGTGGCDGWMALCLTVPSRKKPLLDLLVEYSSDMHSESELSRGGVVRCRDGVVSYKDGDDGEVLPLELDDRGRLVPARGKLDEIRALLEGTNGGYQDAVRLSNIADSLAPFDPALTKRLETRRNEILKKLHRERWNLTRARNFLAQ